MADKLKEIPAKILEWWNKFTTRQKSIIVGAAAVVIFAFAIIMYVMSKPQYVRLITCETTSQASEIIDTLDSAGIAHKESNDGLKIDVESSQQSAANLALGSAGYVPDALDLNDYLGGSMSTTATDTLQFLSGKIHNTDDRSTERSKIRQGTSEFPER